MTESELYNELGALTENRDEWEAMIPRVASLLSSGSLRVRAKALWLLGEMGLKYPSAIRDHVPDIASFLDSEEPLLRSRAVNALGRIGRGGYPAVEPYRAGLFRFASDGDAKVRHSFLWASENIAVNAPDLYGDHMDVFAKLLYDEDERVRREAPEVFRVVGKQRPDLIAPYADLLRGIAEADSDRVVRIHCLGALRAAGLEQE